MLHFDTDALVFKNFMQEHQQRVFNMVLNMLQHYQDAEDITQDVFADAFEKQQSFRGDSSVQTWLYRIAMNKCIDQLRRKELQRRWTRLSSLLSNTNNVTNRGSVDFVHPGTLAENHEKAVILYKALQKLAVNQRTAYVLSETEHLSYREISEVMKLSVSSVESLLFRAKKNLRNILETFYTG